MPIEKPARKPGQALFFIRSSYRGIVVFAYTHPNPLSDIL